ncbi:MAG: c-type cytochrome [Azovibrio sp.]|uniref:c-type cytochrome n=1 Tax=Azovibrio sp. TaxID=1872673 RepID=UPI003C7158F7
MIRTMALAALLVAGFTVNAAEEAKPKADPAKGKVVAETICVACHGVDGNSMVSAYPHLAGQGQDYIYKQLLAFKSVDGKPAARNNPIMAGMTAALSDEDMKNVAAWFAQQQLKPAMATQEALIPRGQKLWRAGDAAKGVPACAGCHGPAGKGLPAQYPALAGQFPEYIELQLKSFRSGERANDPESMMRSIADRLSDNDIKSVAEYAAGLR